LKKVRLPGRSVSKYPSSMLSRMVRYFSSLTRSASSDSRSLFRVYWMCDPKMAKRHSTRTRVNVSNMFGPSRYWKKLASGARKKNMNDSHTQ
jgi:hypothetical protein